jgi:hypothetical protein
MVQAALLVSICLAGIGFAIYRIVGRMSAFPELQRRPELSSGILDVVDPRITAFLAEKGFRFSEAYQFHNLRIGIWELSGNHLPLRYLSAALSLGNITYEFITAFSDDYSLTTTRTRAAFLFPRPYGSFIQSFPNASIQQLWDLHTRGEHHLTSVLSIPVKECRFPYEQRVGAAILKQMRCIKSFPLWPVRGVYWFLLKRFLLQNRPIWNQNVTFYRKID